MSIATTVNANIVFAIDATAIILFFLDGIFYSYAPKRLKQNFAPILVIRFKPLQAIITVFCNSSSEDNPEWFFLPGGYDNASLNLKNISGKKAISRLLKHQ